jgi:hypothetical protein
MRTIIPSTPSDLTQLSLEQAIGLLGEPIQRTYLLCSRQEAGVVEGIAVARKRDMPMVFFVPDMLLNHHTSWALVGEHAQVVNEPDA